MTTFLFSKFCNCLKTNKTIAILIYTNLYYKILFLLFQEGLIRGFYFDYVFNTKYIIILLKYNTYPYLILNLNSENNLNLKLLICTTNCGIVINSQQKQNPLNKSFFIHIL